MLICDGGVDLGDLGPLGEAVDDEGVQRVGVREGPSPGDEQVGEVTESLAEVLGNRGRLVLGYDVRDQPRSDAAVLINGNVVECVELVEVPDEEAQRARVRATRSERDTRP